MYPLPVLIIATYDKDGNPDAILVGEIVNVCADESVLTDGKIDPKKLKPIAFDPVNNTYLAMGDKVGDAFGSGKALK